MPMCVRMLAIFPALAAGVGFILAMMCLFAGSSPGYREDMDMMTLNTSMIGINVFQPSTPSQSAGSENEDGVFNNIGTKVSEIGKNISSEIEDGLNHGIQDIARQLNISDFYSWHVLDYCHGYFEPNPVVNDTNPNPAKNVTGCSNKTAFYNFNATQFLSEHLRSDINLSSIVPGDVEDAIQTATTAAGAMFVLYCLGSGLTGLAMFTGFMGIISHKPLWASVNATIDMIAFLSLGIASSISTGVINKLVDGINNVGSDIGLSAKKGYKFILLSWMATLIMFIGWLGWMLDFWMAKRRKAKAAPQKSISDYEAPHPDDRVYMHN